MREFFVITAILVFAASSTVSAEKEESSGMIRKAHYVPSTHWDREWYESFQGFRMSLVSMLDEVFEIFVNDPAFKSFDMDGQVLPVFDYLEIHPENRKMIEGFVKNERLKLGPWYILPDEWLVSGGVSYPQSSVRAGACKIVRRAVITGRFCLRHVRTYRPAPADFRPDGHTCRFCLAWNA